MFHINNTNSLYTDIINTSHEQKTGFVASEKSTATIDYDLRTNKSKLQKIKMQEIKKDNNE